MRPSGQYPVAVGIGVIAWTMFATGFSLIAVGFVFLVVEAIHTALETHAIIIWPNLALAFGCVIGGAQLVKTGSVQGAIAVVRDSMLNRKPGGDRHDDPPLSGD